VAAAGPTSRVHGEELVITARTEAGLAKIARHQLFTPGNPRIDDGPFG
jgi:hypothetical protein